MISAIGRPAAFARLHAGKTISRLAGLLIADSIHRAMDEHVEDVTLIAYALQVACGYWICKSGDEEARESGFRRCLAGMRLKIVRG